MYIHSYSPYLVIISELSFAFLLNFFLLSSISAFLMLIFIENKRTYKKWKATDKALKIIHHQMVLFQCIYYTR